MLTSRSGPEAPGANQLREELTALGATVRIEACDATDRAALETLLDTITPPLTAVIHTAGALDDGVLGALTPTRMRGVLAPKVDAALRGDAAVAVPVRLDHNALRTQAADSVLPNLLHGLVRRVRRAAAPSAAEERGVLAQLAGLSAGEQEEVLLALIRQTAAQVLGLPGADSFSADAFFFEAGFDSLTAVELRNRLSNATTARLSPTFVFDYPTPQLLAVQLREEITALED